MVPQASTLDSGRGTVRFRAVGLLLLSSTVVAGAPGSSDWQVLRDHAGKCQLSVPEDWKAVSGFGLASDPASHATVAIHADQHNGWSELREVARRTLKPTRILEETGERYFYEFGGSGLHYYVARRFPGFNCIAQVDVQNPASVAALKAVAERIVMSMDKAR
jgi:hypothetical protein